MILFTDFSFGALESIFFLIPIAVLFCILIVYKTKKSVLCSSMLVSNRWAKLLLKHFSKLRIYFKMIFLFAGFLFLSVAFLRPQWDKKQDRVEQEGRDLFIALDISRSMLAEDEKPSRLEAAKKKIKKLVKNLSCERVGLILFSGAAFIQCPLTNDYGAFFLFLDDVDVETISTGTTAIDQAIKKALESFEKIGNRKNKLLALFTDGEDFSTNLKGIKELAFSKGATIFTFGVGTEGGAPIPLVKENGHQKDEFGKVVISKLNVGLLKSLSHDSGGIFVRSTQDDSDIILLMDRVQKIEKERLEDKNVIRPEEQYCYFAFASFLCFLLEWLI
ncbi:VWA domain-containing protein [bacterium]|jgi:Ca-activated chloride channel homolog|nr:VWA domain-containing protein [bacterium]